MSPAIQSLGGPIPKSGERKQHLGPPLGEGVHPVLIRHGSNGVGKLNPVVLELLLSIALCRSDPANKGASVLWTKPR